MVNAVFVNPNYYYPEEFREKGDIFFEHYQKERELSPPLTKVAGLKPKNSRVCRFCHKKYPFVSFNMEAHIIPEMLGRNNLVSDFECDDCNSKFSKYENDFANYLGLSRTANFIKGKERIPKFKSADKNLVAEIVDDPDEGNIMSIKRFDGLNKTFEFDKDKRQTIITYTKGPYTPLKIYKYLVKLGLSLLQDQDLSDYKFAMEYLRTNKHDENITGFAMLQVYHMPLTFQYQTPTMILFKKRKASAPLFTNLFFFAAMNYIFQVILPFNGKDRPFYQNGRLLDTFWCPPLFGSDGNYENGFVSRFSMDLNSTERLYGQKEQLIIPSKEGEYDKSRFIDKKTGEITEEPFDPTQIVGINIHRTEIH